MTYSQQMKASKADIKAATIKYDYLMDCNYGLCNLALVLSQYLKDIRAEWERNAIIRVH